ncbi:MAG: BspA family leucine-rich repeat surface protein, partial [Anaerovoracaceae bacterium]
MEGKLDGWEKEGVHGGIKKIYPAITQANPYRFANEAEQPWSEEREEILRVDSWNEIFPEDMSYWFKNCENLKELEGDKIRCTNLTKMVSTFENAGSKAENLVYRFYHGSASSPWETGKVKEMTDAFKRCGYGAKELRLMGIGQWDVSGTEQFEGMFDQCGYKVKAFQLDLSRWNTQNAVTFDHMFKNAGAYSERFDLGDLSHWNTKTVTSLNSMFAFSGGKAKTWSAGDFSGWNTGAVTDLRYMFGAAAEQADVQFDLSAWDVSKVTTMDSTFSHLGTEAKNWSIGDLSQWNVGAVESFTSTFYFLGKNAEQISLGNLKDWDLSSATDTSGMFYRFGENAKTTFIGDLSAWNVSNVRRMDHMFHSFAYGNTGVVDIGKLNRWNTEKVISMSNMFNEAGSHGKLFDIGRFRIGKNVS